MSLRDLQPIRAKTDELDQISQILDASVIRMREDPLNFGYPPHAGQEELHTTEHDEEIVLLISANRWGKSEGGMREILWRARGEHPYKNVPFIDTIWVGFPDFPFYNRVTKVKFEQWCPKDWIISFHETEKWAKIRRADGGVCIIHFLSYDSGREKWQGAAVDLCWLDEECPEDIFREAMARLIDRRGQMLMTLTPVSGMGWIYDRIFLPLKQKTLKGKLIEGALAWYDPKEPFGVGAPRVPHLSRKDIIRFAKTVPDEDERSIRVFGQFKSRTGVVYKQFRPEVHIVPPFKIPSHWEVWGGLDPGYHGFAATLFAQSPDGRIFIIDEYFSQQESMKVRAPGLLQMCKKHLGDSPLGWDDSIVFYVDTADPQMILELNHWTGERNIPIVYAALNQGKKARHAGITRAQELLTCDKARRKPDYVNRLPSSIGEPLLYIFDGIVSKWRMQEDSFQECRLTWELSRYLWKNPPEGTPEPVDADERTAGGAHMLAAFRYGIMSRIGAPEPLEEEEEDLHPVWQRLREIERSQDWVIE